MKLLYIISYFGFMSAISVDALAESEKSTPKSQEFLKKIKLISNSKFQDINDGPIGLDVSGNTNGQSGPYMGIFPRKNTLHVQLVCAGFVGKDFEKSELVQTIPRWDDVPNVRPTTYVSKENLEKVFSLLKSKGITFSKSMGIRRDHVGTVMYLDKTIDFNVKPEDIDSIQKIFGLMFLEGDWKSISISYNGGVKDRVIVEK